MVLKVLHSLTFMVLMGILFGLISGGIPLYSEEISTIALVIAMTLSLTQIDVRQIRLKKDEFLLPLILNYGVLSLVTIGLGLLFPEDIQFGFIIIAAVPPAIAIIPLTRILKGDIEYSLVSLTFLYVISLLLTPLMLFLLIGQRIDLMRMIQTILVLITIPLLVSQYIRRFDIPSKISIPITNICFFILIFILVGKNRPYLIQQFTIIVLISIAAFIKAFGTGGLIKMICSKMNVRHEKQIPLILFSSIKNEAFAIILALSLFGGITVVPPIIALIFEMLWIGCYESKIC